jgi:arginine/ornithine N-succinyltransferase beta subunit
VRSENGLSKLAVMSPRTLFLLTASIACFAASYRFGSHGFRLHDNQCVGLAAVAVGVGLALLWFAFRLRRPKHE